MSKFPIDIVSFSETFETEISMAIEIANKCQSHFLFTPVKDQVKTKFELINYKKIESEPFFNKASKIRQELKGYYPHLCFFTEAPLNGNGWTNLFADANYKSGISIITSHNVPDKIIPTKKMLAYFVYYLGRGALKFILKDFSNHSEDEAHGCIYDFMKNKTDILKSMNSKAICDECKVRILETDSMLSEDQILAIRKILGESGKLLSQQVHDKVLPKVFIGSSVEGLNVARAMQSSLDRDANVEIWSDGLFDKPSQTYFEVLEHILDNYDYGIFVFTPDDQIYSRGKGSSVPRDNVIFEYGMFTGKHSRHKSCFIIPRNTDIKLMSDVGGFTRLEYNSDNPNIQASVGHACNQVRQILLNL